LRHGSRKARFFEYESVAVCVGVNETRKVFEISSFGANRLYRIIYANVLYFVVIHGGPLLFIAFFNVKLIHALKRRRRRWAEMGKSWYQHDVSVVLVVVMCVFIVCQTPTFVDHILPRSVYLSESFRASSTDVSALRVRILFLFADKENWKSKSIRSKVNLFEVLRPSVFGIYSSSVLTDRFQILSS